MKYLIALLLLVGCKSEFKPKFKEGTYVKHVQSDCIGVIAMTYHHGNNKGNVVVEDYICEIKHEDFKYTKKLMFDTHEENLIYAGNKTVEEYNQALFLFMLREEKNDK